MKKLLVILTCLASIIYLIWVNNYLLNHFENPLNYENVKSYNVQYNKLKEKTFKPVYENIILIILDGALKEYLCNDKICPNINAIWKGKGLRFTNAECILPSVSAPNYFSILSGAPVFIHGVTNNSRRFTGFQKVDSLFEIFRKNNISSAVIGFNWYKEMFEGKTEYYPAECCEKDDSNEVTSILINLIKEKRLPQFTLVHYLAPDNAAHQTGSNKSKKYINSITKIDELLGEAFKKLEENYTKFLFIVMADHGMNVDGNHGGRDSNSISIPLYLIAKNLAHNEVNRKVLNLSVTPTVTALMGLDIPAFSSGTLIYEVLDNNRRLAYLNEVTGKKQKILNELRSIEATSLFVGQDLEQSIKERDNALTSDILEFPESYKIKILFYQSIISIILLVLFIFYIIYKTESGIPLLTAVNGFIMFIIGLSLPLINCKDNYNKAVSVYIIALIALSVFYKYKLLDPELSERLNRFGYLSRLLSILLPLLIILTGFFIPFYTTAPDSNIFAFRFYTNALLHPFLFVLLLYFINRV